MNHILVNDFFDDPDRLRQTALSLDEWRVMEDPSPVGWKGSRTKPLSHYKNKLLDDSTQLIFDYIWDVMDLDNWRYPDWDNGRMFPNGAFPGGKIRDPILSSFFHISTERSKGGYCDWQDRFHKDFLPCAGLVYLTPDAPLDAGTSILDSDRSQFINIDNKYNRLLVYDGYNIHGPSNFFGNTKECGRMTLVFFIHEREFTEENINLLIKNQS